MIYVTGDTHIPIDIGKLNTSNFPQQKTMTKNDYVIICGDFGGIWSGGKDDAYWLKWLKEKPFTTLFVDGNHENFNLLNQYPVTEWNGGLVHVINDSIIHLMRGQVFTIDGLKFFTMGGALSIDKARRKEGVSWWKEELPTHQEFETALDNLEKHSWTVDYVLSHTTSLRNMEEMVYIKESTSLNTFFERLEERLVFNHWFFGHFHTDRTLREKYTCLYQAVIPIK